MATMNKSDFNDRLQHACEAVGLPKFQDIPPTHDFPPGVYLWPLLQLVEALIRKLNALQSQATRDAWQ